MIDLENLPTLPIQRRLSKPQQNWLLLIGALLLLALGASALVIHWALTPAQPLEEKLPVGTFRPTASQRAGLGIMTVSTNAAADQIIASGVIANDDTRGTPVFMPYGGQITHVYVDTGARVTPRAPLLRIKTPDFVDARNTLLAANATERTATAQLKIAQDNATRQKAIYETAGGALKDYRQSQSDLIAAQSALRTAQAALGDARDKLVIFGKSAGEISKFEHQRGVSGIQPETILRAPVRGVIAARAAAPGQYVTSGGSTPVFTIADPSHVWLIAQLTEDDASHVHLGDQVVVTTTAYKKRLFHAQIDNIAAGLDPTTHRLAVRASIENRDGALKPQMFASFTIIGHNLNPDAPSIPTNAVIHEGDSARVWVLRPDGLLQARSVTLGNSVGGQVNIASGLKIGEKIVSAGALFVNEAGTAQ